MAGNVTNYSQTDLQVDKCDIYKSTSQVKLFIHFKAALAVTGQRD